MLYPISIPNPASADDLIGYIDPCGEVVVAPIYEAGAFFSEGKAAIMPSGGKTGFLGANGQLALPFEFEGLGYFHEGLCSIGRDCLVGAISQSGTWIVRPEFAFISEFSDGLAFASEDGQHVGFIDVTGAFRIPARFETAQCFRSGLAAVRQGGRWGYLDADGDIRIPFRFDGPRAQPFTCGMAGVCSGGAWGFIDAHGEWRIRPQFDDIRPFSEGCAAVRRNNKWGLIDLSGTVLTEFRFDGLGKIEAGIAPARVDGKAGFVSTAGVWEIQPEFDSCSRFTHDLAIVRRGRVYSYITRCGQIVWTSETDATPPSVPFAG